MNAPFHRIFALRTSALRQFDNFKKECLYLGHCIVLSVQKVFFSILTFQRCLELSLLGPGLKNSLARFPVFDDPPVPAGSGESGNGAEIRN